MYGSNKLIMLKIGYSNPSWSWRKTSQNLSEISKHTNSENNSYSERATCP